MEIPRASELKEEVSETGSDSLPVGLPLPIGRQSSPPKSSSTVVVLLLLDPEGAYLYC